MIARRAIGKAPVSNKIYQQWQVKSLASGITVPEAEKLEEVRQSAIAFCPALATATTIKTWSGLRPRPEARPAPIIELLEGFSNVLLATGHYRNGVLLAPATAQRIIKLLEIG